MSRKGKKRDKGSCGSPRGSASGPRASQRSAHHPDDPRLFCYPLGAGWEVLVGRSERDNDRLSLKVAKPNDWWFHVRSMPGSHVILRRTAEAVGDVEADRQILKKAAAIAAYHSKARAGGVVSVSVTQAKYVKKPRGAPPGTVEIHKEKVLKVRPALPAAPSSADTEG
jgi:predicted ribosome quality control (RQC) complex YloA/Tae2 family protein